ncbi:hypothetical protein COX24_00670 [bacterium (Candidatus Gribaldobacteria) CG23_combo_of_CG06-09_8_20_14_all_37_87_8]|uniref:DUF86 domain-containing protein n=1 Tax=bacterium (Candidatus Gribaldobacteria) CG23_combo_of_CG06-09_8_20_14_all_37_87_8 TaxID=2014278 RepID=A0A2G9ZFM4_9BACT|nr:MAG: hypothetical protein COX24_00670 [bacterium (Candidatus Gribaldobacteria) CG23_combo_of_CG06-09_8_20_14_all_37_87_8]
MSNDLKKALDRDKIIERIGDIKEATKELKIYQDLREENFLSKKENFYLASYWLRIAIEAVLTIATHILSRIPTNGKQKDYTQVILSLADYNVLPSDFAQKIKGMAGYRNRLVHLYWKVRPEELYSIVKNDLSDFDGFIDNITRFLNS